MSLPGWCTLVERKLEKAEDDIETLITALKFCQMAFSGVYDDEKRAKNIQIIIDNIDQKRLT